VRAASAVTFVARELSATLRVGLAAPRGWRGKSWRKADRLGEDAVVLVHGLMATAAAFSPLVRFLHDEFAIDVRTFSFPPGSTLEGIAARIDAAVATHRRADRIHLIGHSLGGLAVRRYVQSERRDPRVVQTVSIASPFAPIALATAVPDPLRRLAFPLQHEIDRLVSGARETLAEVPHLSIVAERDQLVSPASAAILPGAPHFVLHDTGHNGALFHPKLFDAIAHAIEEGRRHHHRRSSPPASSSTPRRATG
jgi:triacylglycerol lipase